MAAGPYASDWSSLFLFLSPSPTYGAHHAGLPRCRLYQLLPCHTHPVALPLPMSHRTTTTSTAPPTPPPRALPHHHHNQIEEREKERDDKDGSTPDLKEEGLEMATRSWGHLAVLGTVFCASNVVGNISFRYLPVSFNQVVGATTPFFTAIPAYVGTMHRRPAARSIVSHRCVRRGPGGGVGRGSGEGERKGGMPRKGLVVVEDQMVGGGIENQASRLRCGCRHHCAKAGDGATEADRAHRGGTRA